MHDLVRLYAIEQAKRDLTADDQTAAPRRLVDFYLRTAYACQRLTAPIREPIELGPPAAGCRPQEFANTAAALAWFDTEHHSLLAAQHLAMTHGWHRIAWQLAWVMDEYQWRRGHLHDHLACWRIALDAAEQLGDATTNIRTSWLLGQAQAQVGNYTDALNFLSQALRLAERNGDIFHQGNIHITLAKTWETRGDSRRALTHCDNALRLFQTVNDQQGQGRALIQAAWQQALLGCYDQARDSCERALPLIRQANRRHDDEASCLDTLGYIAHNCGQYDEARNWYHQALALRMNVGNVYSMATVLDHLAEANAALGDHDQARRLWREAFETFRTQNRTIEAGRIAERLDSIDSRSGSD